MQTSVPIRSTRNRGVVVASVVMTQVIYVASVDTGKQRQYTQAILELHFIAVTVS